MIDSARPRGCANGRIERTGDTSHTCATDGKHCRAEYISKQILLALASGER